MVCQLGKDALFAKACVEASRYKNHFGMGDFYSYIKNSYNESQVISKICYVPCSTNSYRYINEHIIGVSLKTNDSLPFQVWVFKFYKTIVTFVILPTCICIGQ